MRFTSTLAALAAAAPLVSAIQVSQTAGLVVYNRCPVDFAYSMVPGGGGGMDIYDGTLTRDKPFFQYWTQLNQLPPNPENKKIGGWSLKVNTINDFLFPMQIEYTWAAADGDYNNGKQIAWDISYVNLPSTKWDLTPMFHVYAPDAALPTHDNYYRFDVDDSRGMQPNVPVTSNATVYLCPLLADYHGDALPHGYTPPAAAAPAPATTLQTSAAISKVETRQLNYVPPTSAITTAAAPSPTTSSTKATTPSTTSTKATTPSTTPSTTTPSTTAKTTPATTDAAEVVVTEFITNYVTEFVTQTAGGPDHHHRKRHIHGHRLHAHNHQH